MDSNEAVDSLRRAERIVDEAGVAEDLRPVAYSALLQRLLDDPVTRARDMRSTPAPVQQAAKSPKLEGTTDQVASSLGLEPSTLDAIYAKSDGELEVVVASRRLATSKGDAAKQLALLTVGGRQLGGWDEEWTLVERVRDVCREHGKFQSNHFAETISEMENVFAFRGSARGRQLRLLRPGREALAELIVELTGADSVGG